MQAERVHQNLLNGLEDFDKSTMKHTETLEKVCLPNSEGKIHSFSLLNSEQKR